VRDVPVLELNATAASVTVAGEANPLAGLRLS
jgi:hypothetical protein